MVLSSQCVLALSIMTVSKCISKRHYTRPAESPPAQGRRVISFLAESVLFHALHNQTF